MGSHLLRRLSDRDERNNASKKEQLFPTAAISIQTESSEEVGSVGQRMEKTISKINHMVQKQSSQVYGTSSLLQPPVKRPEIIIEPL